LSLIKGYSTSGSSISPGCGTLLSVSYEGTISDINNIIFATTFGEQLNIDYPTYP